MAVEIVRIQGVGFEVETQFFEIENFLSVAEIEESGVKFSKAYRYKDDLSAEPTEGFVHKFRGYVEIAESKFDAIYETSAGELYFCDYEAQKQNNVFKF